MKQKEDKSNLVTIDDRWAIKFDGDINYTVKKTTVAQKGKKKGEKVTESIAYCSTFESALLYIARMLTNEGAGTLQIEEYISRFEAIVNNLIKTVKAERESRC